METSCKYREYIQMDTGEFSVMEETPNREKKKSYTTKNLSTVLVMMSTYNGEKYLKEQIDSILGQTGVDVKLVIRDDVSTDRTRNILLEYEAVNNIDVLYGLENLGPGESFMSLFYDCFDAYCDFDYYAFADQDDVWLPDKLSRAVNLIQTDSDNDKPFLYCSNQILYESGKEIGYRFKESPDLTLLGHMNKNMLSGCTFVMNRNLVKKICYSEHAGKDVIARRIHDAWIMLCAITCGRVMYDQESKILYRIHENNVVGVKKISVLKAVKIKWNNLTNKSFGNIRMKTAEQLLRSFPEVEGRDREVLELYANYRKGWKNKRLLFRDKEIMKSLNGTIPGWVKVLINLI